MGYKLLLNGPGVIRLLDGAFIPSDATNADWVSYLAWLASGNTASEADPEPGPTRDEADAASARAYTKLQALVGMTPGQVQAWVSANVTTLGAAQDAIATLAIAVSVLGRRL